MLDGFTLPVSFSDCLKKGESFRDEDGLPGVLTNLDHLSSWEFHHRFTLYRD